MSKQWVEENGGYSLYFTMYEETEFLAKVFCEEDGGWCYSSNLLRSDAEYLGSDTAEDAKEEVEYFIESHYESERNHFQNLLDEWKKEDE